MHSELILSIILKSPPPGVDFGLQSGSGSNYSTVQIQRSGSHDLHFKFPVKVKQKDENSPPDFAGPFVHGPVDERFIYIDIGTSAGQADSIWTRRLKIPLRGIDWAIIEKISSGKNLVLETRVPGTGKDGGPNCATVKPFEGWNVVSYHA